MDTVLLPIAQLMESSQTPPLLSLLIGLPLLGALLLALVPREQKELVRASSLVMALLTFGASCALPIMFSDGYRSYQFVESYEWIPQFGIRYELGLDGISLWLVMLTTALMPVALMSSFHAIEKREKEYYISLLLLEAAMLGALVSLDVFLFYIFWEAMLIPMFLLIGVWGGQNRLYATVKFFLFTMVGSLLMLVAILYLYFKTGADLGAEARSFSLGAMLSVPLSPNEQMWLFGAFGLAFLIKVPLFPFHTWLPDAHTEAPTAGSVILAAVLLKMGTYGLVRYALPLFPLAVVEFAPYIGVLSVIGIIYGALVAMVQKDVKRLVAYSSVSHLGFVVLGLVALTPQGVEGGIFQMLAHGVSTGGLFLCIGILYERRHTREIKEYGGLAKQVPIFTTCFMIITLSSAGLPGMNGFVGEFLILVGTFTSGRLFGGWSQILAAGAATGMILSAVYLLWMFQRMMFGPLNNPKNLKLKDLNLREATYLAPILILIFVMGVYPEMFMKHIRPSAHEFFRIFHSRLAQSKPQQRAVASLTSEVSPSMTASAQASSALLMQDSCEASITSALSPMLAAQWTVDLVGAPLGAPVLLPSLQAQCALPMNPASVEIAQ
jgi:NADH-quinone oxidoreductase subunit M